ncbi:LemA family protein [Ramlibacter sp. USB13]|uniref:LemA family protein n=1 Tax=Ramlibacter cellulosilyticus TaxID=2764187 RepID=A0A923MUY4_9BURK|nr:LemA family protein [Ramlibacter cellulosilyticus]MBC5785496.1 LemA family protein [Ramlibacter cellulosilyticus]
MQTSSFLPWVLAALALFWAVGAYNRLVRLRSDANAAFAALEAELSKQVKLVHACVPPEEEQAQSQFTGGSAFWGGLQGAAAQLSATLGSARAKPLDAERIAALGAAQEVLAMAWDRAERDDAHDLAGPRLPEDFSSERQQLERMTQAATEHFNVAVRNYNDAIAQFPAALLAWLFGFQPARGLRARP